MKFEALQKGHKIYDVSENKSRFSLEEKRDRNFTSVYFIL